MDWCTGSSMSVATDTHTANAPILFGSRSANGPAAPPRPALQWAGESSDIRCYRTPGVPLKGK